MLFSEQPAPKEPREAEQWLPIDYKNMIYPDAMDLIRCTDNNLPKNDLIKIRIQKTATSRGGLFTWSKTHTFNFGLSNFTDEPWHKRNQ